MKEKRIYIISTITLILIILATLVISVYANYSKVISQGTDIAYIATWNVTMDELDSNFFSHDYFMNLAEGNNLLAPGVSGSSTIILNNESDVKAKITKITFKLQDTENVIPFKFSADKENWAYLDENGTTIQIDNNILEARTK